MKLTDMKVELIKIPLKKPFRIAFAVQEHSVNVLVKLITDEGVWGIGEAAPFEPVTGENANTVMEALKLFKQGLLGRDPMDLEGIHQMMDNLSSGNTAAKAAVDIALYDIKGKVMGQPLYKVLGGSRYKIVTDMTIGIDKPELMAQEARERVERDGFTILKVKAGICPQDDIRALTLIREAVGPGVRLRVDANQGYTVGDAVRTLKAFEQLGVEAVEQCLPWWDVEGAPGSLQGGYEDHAGRVHPLPCGCRSCLPLRCCGYSKHQVDEMWRPLPGGKDQLRGGSEPRPVYGGMYAGDQSGHRRGGGPCGG